jgi:hypothetical protein
MEGQHEHFMLRSPGLWYRVHWSVGTGLTEDRTVIIFCSEDRDSAILQIGGTLLPEYALL